jgi:branched-chain amino acid transport system substrate-binding protein
MHSSEGIKFVKTIKDNGIDIPIITPDAFASKTFQKGFEQFAKERENPGSLLESICWELRFIIKSIIVIS